MLRKSFLLSVLIPVIVLSSCFHKSDKTGEADDIVQMLICSSATGDVLISHEEIFHATSKSYNQGISQITGYTDYRFTVRDVNTGKQVKREVHGDRNDDVMILGFDGKYLWCFNAKEGMGVEARNPATLQVNVSRKNIEEVNPSLKGKLSSPKSYEASQYYGFDYRNHRVIVSDVSGFFYAVDPVSLKATQLHEKHDEFPDVNNTTSTSADIAPEKSIRMNGDLRKYLVINDSVKSKNSFLNGEIILQQDAVTLSRMENEWLSQYHNQLKKQRSLIDSFKNAYPFLIDQSQWYREHSRYDIVYRFRDLNSELDQMVRDSTQGYYKLTRFLENSALGCDSSMIFIVHANNVTDTSSLLISKLKYDDRKVTEEWTALVRGIYFNPDKGIQSNPMKEVFSSGDPEFRFQQYALSGNMLCGIKMLFAFGIDTRNGKLLWKEKL